MAKTQESNKNKEMYECILRLKDLDQNEQIISDQCSITKLKAMEQRIMVAKMLHEGKVYTEICEQTHASSATISRVTRCLQYGAAGYQTILPRLDPIWEEKKHRDTEA